MKSSERPSSEEVSPEEIREMVEQIYLHQMPVAADPGIQLVERLKLVLHDPEIGAELESARRESLLSMGKEYVDFKFEELKEIADRGDLIVERVNGEVVSFCALKPLKTVGANPHVSGQVFELGRAFTKVEYRGQGYYRKVRDRAIEHARQKYPEATLITATDKDQIKEMNRRDGWTEISFSDFLRIYDDPPEEQEGWTAFYLAREENHNSGQ
jgi:predicted GNAT family N-acyltransferase